MISKLSFGYDTPSS